MDPLPKPTDGATPPSTRPSTPLVRLSALSPSTRIVTSAFASTSARTTPAWPSFAAVIKHVRCGSARRPAASPLMLGDTWAAKPRIHAVRIERNRHVLPLRWNSCPFRRSTMAVHQEVRRASRHGKHRATCQQRANGLLVPRLRREEQSLSMRPLVRQALRLPPLPLLPQQRFILARCCSCWRGLVVALPLTSRSVRSGGDGPAQKPNRVCARTNGDSG